MLQELSLLLDNIAKGTIEVFQQQTEKKLNAIQTQWVCLLLDVQNL